MICTSNRMTVSSITVYLTSGKLRSALIFRILGLGKFSFLDYDESKLSLIITVIVSYYLLIISLFYPQYGLKAYFS